MRLFQKKYTYLKSSLALILILFFAISLSSCSRQSYIDPHEGMVSVPNGAGGEMWVPIYENLPVSAFTSDEFISDGTYVNYSGSDYNTLSGIDVSEHQKDIDWQKVRESGVEFAIIRVGYRGYSEGRISEDANFKKNMEGAISAGLKIGVYFFSQAVNTDEAAEEAQFLLKTIEGYNLDLPVFYDWERVSNVGETRTDNVEGSTITDCCLTFCEIINNAGYVPGVYFFRSLGYYEYELNRLANLVFWVGAPGEAPDFYYKHSIWQYSYTGTVNGIEGSTDLNILFEEIPADAITSAPSIVPGEIPPPEVTIPSAENS